MKHSFSILILSLLSVQVLAKNLHLRIGIPADVLAKYQKFIGQREPREVFSYRNKYSSRDVVEVVMLLKILNLTKDKYRFVSIDSYQRALKLIDSGKIDIYATTIWKDDINVNKSFMSPAIIRDGEFTAGIYVKEDSQLLNQPFNIRKIKFLSNRAWTRDWKTIKSLQPKSLISTTTWESLIKMIKANRADAILAAFPPNKTLIRHNDLVNLRPIPNVKVAISGSRHWVISKKSKYLSITTDKLVEGIKVLRKKKEFFKAYMQSGFFNEKTITWKVINKKGHL